MLPSFYFLKDFKKYYKSIFKKIILILNFSLLKL